MASVLLTMVAAFNVVCADLWVRMRDNEIITGRIQAQPVTSNLTPISCVERCSSLARCSAVVTNYPVGKCEMLESNVKLLNFSSSPPDTSFVRWERESSDDKPLDWCLVHEGVVLSTAAQFCFRVVDSDQKNWTDSKRECEKLGLTLVVPDTTLKMNILLNTTRTTYSRESMNFYIGASRPMKDLSVSWNGNSDTFQWINNISIEKDILVPFWGSGQPNNKGNEQNCITMQGSINHLLNDVQCNDQNYFICEKRRR